MVSSLAGTAPMPSGPQRTCVGCRAVAPRAVLLRVVAVTGVAVPDPARRLPGRGANVHSDEECIGLAIRRKSLLRALRVAELQTDDLVAWVRAHGDRSSARAGALSVDSSGAKRMSTR